MSAPAQSDPSLRWRWLLPVIALVAALHFSPIDAALNRAFFDTASRHPLHPSPLPPNSALVLVDEATMKEMSAQGARWPFPRIIFAQLLAALHLAGAEKIVVDFTFLEESDAMQDQLLASVAAAAPTVVLARTTERGPVFWPESFQRTHPQFFSTPRTGLADFLVDDDGIARRYHVPGSLAAAALPAPVSTGGGLLRWRGRLDQFLPEEGLRAPEHRGVQVLSAGPFIHAGRPVLERLAQAAPDLDTASLAQALAAEPALTGATAAAVKGKVVFVGANASGTFDVKPLPIGKLEPGILLHWTAWTNLVADGFICEAGWVLLALVGVLCGGVVLFFGSNRISLVAPLTAAILLVVGLLAGGWVLLAAGWFLPPATPIGATLLVLLGVIIENFWREQRRKREIQAMFGAYVDPEVVAQLVRNPASIRLAGESREATVFFSDLVGFTELSEKLRDRPEQMVEVVNAYLEETSECLHRNGAYVDKYIGDAVMAVFGVPQDLPDHPLAACRAALAARDALETVNARYAAGVGVRLAVRIGLNTGSMIVGNLGSSRKRNYTVMGDAVNLASRLEGANKEFGTHILLGETTARAVAGRMATRPLTRLRVKGKNEANEVHELIAMPETLTAAQRDFLAAYLPAYAYFTARRFAAAAADFGRALAARPDDDVTVELLRQSSEFAQRPPPPDWEPVLTLKSK